MSNYSRVLIPTIVVGYTTLSQKNTKVKRYYHPKILRYRIKQTTPHTAKFRPQTRENTAVDIFILCNKKNAFTGVLNLNKNKKEDPFKGPPPDILPRLRNRKTVRF